jgi:hypothetical protein
VVNLLPGVDPSQHVIDQTINARAHLLHGDTKRRLAHQREQERLQALRYSVVQRLPEAPGEEGPAAAGLLSCAAGPTVLQVLLEAPEAEADASGGWRLAAGCGVPCNQCTCRLCVRMPLACAWFNGKAISDCSYTYQLQPMFCSCAACNRQFAC